MATAALVLGILGFFTCGTTSLFAVVLGHIAGGQIRRTGQFGRGSALAGALLGWLVLLFYLVAFVVLVFADSEQVQTMADDLLRFFRTLTG